MASTVDQWGKPNPDSFGLLRFTGRILYLPSQQQQHVKNHNKHMLKISEIAACKPMPRNCKGLKVKKKMFPQKTVQHTLSKKTARAVLRGRFQPSQKKIKSSNLDLQRGAN